MINTIVKIDLLIHDELNSVLCMQTSMAHHFLVAITKPLPSLSGRETLPVSDFAGQLLSAPL